VAADVGTASAAGNVTPVERAAAGHGGCRGDSMSKSLTSNTKPLELLLMVIPAGSILLVVGCGSDYDSAFSDRENSQSSVDFTDESVSRRSAARRFRSTWVCYAGRGLFGRARWGASGTTR
jgi:hypothetical protein